MLLRSLFVKDEKEGLIYFVDEYVDELGDSFKFKVYYEVKFPYEKRAGKVVEVGVAVNPGLQYKATPRFMPSGLVRVWVLTPKPLSPADVNEVVSRGLERIAETVDAA